MPHPYQTERVARTAYAIRSGGRLLELLDQNDVQDTLGIAALKLRTLTGDAFVPLVTEPLSVRSGNVIGQSCVRLSYEQRGKDHVPILAVRPDETLTRDPYFYQPTPCQVANAEAVKTELVDPRPAARLIGLGERNGKDCTHEGTSVRAALDTTPLVADEYAVCQSLAFRDKHPFRDVTTTLRWRPLVLLRYNPDVPHVPLGPLAQALVHAGQVLENPVYITEGRGYEPLEQNWLAEAQAIGAQVARFAGE
jgi:hypothetical protein